MSQVEYGPLAEYYELCNGTSVDYDGQARLVAEAWARFAEGPVPRVLDVACGAGLLSRRLLAAGAGVVGVDLSPALCVQAGRVPGLRVVRGDMRGLPFVEAFDIATCLLHTINYMTGDADLAAAMGSMAAAVRPGGLVILDFLAYEPRQEWNARWTYTVAGDGVTIICDHDQTADWQTMVATDRHTYTVREAGRVRSVQGVDRLRITSAAELRSFAGAVGLTVLALTAKYALDRAPGWDGGVLIAQRRAG
jgi:SAM-dependent methyltransferase